MSIWTDLLVLHGHISTPRALAALSAEPPVSVGDAPVARAAAGGAFAPLQRAVPTRPPWWLGGIRLR